MVKKRMQEWLVALSLPLLVAACTPPEERAAEYMAAGEALLEAGEPLKARLEFRNALQIDEELSPAYFGLAKVAESQAEWREAFRLLERTVELDPENLTAQLMRGRLLLAAGQLDKALEVSEIALALSDRSAPALALRAAVFFKLGDTDEAVMLAEEALSRDSNNIDALAALATERLQAGEPAAAIEFLDRGLGADAGNTVLLLIKIEALDRLNDTEGVETVFQRLIELNPDTNTFRYRLAQFYLERFREDDAEAVYRSIVDANPEDREARLNLVRFINSIRGSEPAIAELQRQIAMVPDDGELPFVLAQLQASTGDYEAAVATLKQIAETAEALELRNRAKGQWAALIMRQGDVESGMVLVDEILAEDPRNEQAVLLKAAQQIDRAQLDEAISSLRTVLRDSPNSARVLLMLGRAHELQDAPELADDLYARAFEASLESAEYAVPYAQFLLRQRRVDRATTVLESALAGTSSAHVPAMALLARIYVGRGQWEQAQAMADRIEAQGDAGQISNQIRSAVFAGREDYEGSINLLRQVYDTASSPDGPMASLVQTYVRAGRVDDAYAFLDSVLEASPDNIAARQLKGLLYANQGKWEQAAGLLEAVIEAEPTRAPAWQALAAVYARQQNLPRALEVLSGGLEANPDSVALRLNRAGMFEQTGAFDRAIADYERLLESRPNADVAINNLASLLTDHRGDEVSLQRALELASRFRNSDVPHFRDTLGWALYRLGRLDDALPLLEAAVRDAPEVPIFRYHLGMVQLGVGNRDGARGELQEALRLSADEESTLRIEIEAALADAQP